MNQTVKSKPSSILQPQQPRHSVENKLATTTTLNTEKRIKTKHQTTATTTTT